MGPHPPLPATIIITMRPCAAVPFKWTMDHSLAAVASRIQERNNALLRSELATLELPQSQHNQAKQCLKADE